MRAQLNRPMGLENKGEVGLCAHGWGSRVKVGMGQKGAGRAPEGVGRK